LQPARVKARCSFKQCFKAGAWSAQNRNRLRRIAREHAEAHARYTGKSTVRSLLAIVRLRRRSLSRAVLLALLSLAAAAGFAGFPAPDAPRQSNWQILSVLLAAWCMVESFRCLERKWDLYHAGVLLLLYAGLMLLVLSLFLWIYP
jgi:hypothetical protein